MPVQPYRQPVKFAIARAALAGCEIISSRSHSATGTHGEPWVWRTSRRRCAAHKTFRQPAEAAMDFFDSCRVEELPDSYVTVRLNPENNMQQLFFVSWAGKGTQRLKSERDRSSLRPHIKAALARFEVPYFDEVTLRFINYTDEPQRVINVPAA